MKLRHSLTMMAIAFCLTAQPDGAALARTDATLNLRHKFDVPPQPLSSALRLFSVQAKVRILFPYDEAAGLRGRRLEGWLSTGDALRRLLAGTGFRHSEAGLGVIALNRPTDRSGWLMKSPHRSFGQIASGCAVPSTIRENIQRQPFAFAAAS